MHGSDYEVLAPFYNALLRNRNHFEAQANMLQRLCSRLNIGKMARLLDAACGTGESLVLLHKNGWLNISGLDGSKAMLAEAHRLETLTGVSLNACSWENLDEYFSTHDTYDLVFFLGHALPHAPLELVRKVLGYVFDGLNPGGYLLFDMRKWSRAPDGGLFQEGRPAGVSRQLGMFTVDEKDYLIDECCTYISGRQQIEYRIRKARKDGTGEDGAGEDKEKKPCLFYTPFTVQEAMDWLSETGFQNIEWEQPSDWPYMILFGQKK